MEMLTGMLELLGPVVVGILTVPLFGAVKKAVSFLDDLPAAAQQITVVLVAFGLTQLGGFVDVVLPESLGLFVESDVSGLLSGVLAMAIHAGKKAKG